MAKPSVTPQDTGWRPDFYEWYFRETPTGRRLRARDERLVFDALGTVLEPGHAVLEAGCGTGNYTVPIARRCARVVALDASQAMLGHLEERLRREGVSNVETGLGRLPDALGTDETFDGVVSLGVLNYVADLDAAVRALVARVRPGGWVMLTVPPRTLEGWVHVITDRFVRRHVYLHAAGATVAAAERTGLRVLRTGSAGLTRGGITFLVLGRRPAAG